MPEESHAYVLDYMLMEDSLDEKHPGVKYGVTTEQQLTHALPVYKLALRPPFPEPVARLYSNWLDRAQVAQAGHFRTPGFYSKITAEKSIVIIVITKRNSISRLVSKRLLTWESSERIRATIEQYLS
jgi:hypothetical protein